MSLDDLPALIILLLLIVASGFFSGSETALFSLRHGERHRLRRDAPGVTRAVNTLLASPRLLLITILLLNMAVNVTYFVLSSVTARHIEHPVAAIGFSLASIMGLILFGEVLAKLLASLHRIAFIRIIAHPLLAIHRLIAPLRTVLDRFVVSPLTRLIRPEHAPEPAPLSADELDALLHLSEHQGVIDIDEQRILADVIDLSRRRVRDVMTPRVDLAWLTESASRRDVLELVAKTRLTKIPICRESLDDGIQGMLNVKRYLAESDSNHKLPMAGFIEQVQYAPELARLDQLLEDLRKSGDHIAISVDERGDTVGLVEIEDVAQELLSGAGPQAGADEDDVQLIALGRWLVPGRLSAHDLCEAFGGQAIGGLVGQQRVATVAGLILVALGRLPQVGEAVTLGNVRLEVEAMSDRTIQRVIVSVIDPQKVPDAESGSGGLH